MDRRPPIDRVREREQAARQPLKDDRQAFTEKEAKLRDQAGRQPEGPESEGDFLERMQEKLKENSNEE